MLLAAVTTGRVAELACMPVVVLGIKDESSEPPVISLGLVSLVT